MDGPLSIDTPVQYVPRHAFGYGNFNATTDPGASDDSTQGYTVNSWWYNTVDPYALWICVDNTAGAAIWQGVGLTVRSNWLLDETSASILDETGGRILEG